ncbi:MAG: hypothetical protein GC179_06315 [Anaerolineaceae bacterium]|nr:hypothetical protein [Anaerolineaceae bacterium]
MADKQHYLFMIHPVRGQDFFNDMQPHEEAAMSAHFEYLKQALAEGKLLLAGPMLDKTFGIGLLRVDSEDDARAFLQNDPSVIANVQRPELHPMKLSLWAGKESQ